MPEPDIGMLASAAGLSVAVWLVMQFVRQALAAPVFDRWGALIAGVVGVLFAIAYAVVTTPVLDGKVLLQALLVGLFGGWMSQNVNTMVRRAAAPTPDS